MQSGRLWFVPLLLFNLLFISCGGSPSAPAPVSNPYASITGNWHLTGAGSFSIVTSNTPYIGLVAGVVGNTLYVRGSLAIKCSSGMGIGSSFAASAQIGADGTFVISNSATLTQTVQYSIHGKAPAAGESQWDGSYQLTNSGGSSCTFNQSGTFTATQYPTFSGTYSGTITGTQFGPGATITLQVSQSPPTITTLGTLSNQLLYIPLSGTVSISGSPCLSSATFSGSTQSVLTSDSFLILIPNSDGSSTQLQGWFSDQTETTLQPFAVSFLGGPCAGSFGNALMTLQQQ